MSFSIWRTKPPFAEADLSPGEAIHEVGPYWVVTDGPAPDEAAVEAVLAEAARTSSATKA